MKHSLEYLDWLLGEALEDIEEAAGEVREIAEIEQEKCLMGLGQAVQVLCAIREHLFELKPELRTEASRAVKENSKERYDELVRLQGAALEAEREGDAPRAARLFEELQSYARNGYFRMFAEASLYRLARDGQEPGG